MQIVHCAAGILQLSEPSEIQLTHFGSDFIADSVTLPIKDNLHLFQDLEVESVPKLEVVVAFCFLSSLLHVSSFPITRQSLIMEGLLLAWTILYMTVVLLDHKLLQTLCLESEYRLLYSSCLRTITTTIYLLFLISCAHMQVKFYISGRHRYFDEISRNINMFLFKPDCQCQNTRSNRVQSLVCTYSVTKWEPHALTPRALIH